MAIGSLDGLRVTVNTYQVNAALNLRFFSLTVGKPDARPDAFDSPVVPEIDATPSKAHLKRLYAVLNSIVHNSCFAVSLLPYNLPSAHRGNYSVSRWC